jgi:predicted CXXCH cytochrome family protein
MDMRHLLAPALTFALVAVTTPARGADRRLAPIPRDEAVSSHGPFEMGACDTCHARSDPRNPGPASVTNESCFECHDEFKGTAPVRMEKGHHPKTIGTNCTACHSPHNSKNRKLLLRT